MWHVSLDTFGVLFTILKEFDLLGAQGEGDVVVILGVLGDQSLVLWIVLFGGVDDDDAVGLSMSS